VGALRAPPAAASDDALGMAGDEEQLTAKARSRVLDAAMFAHRGR
jgi:hypothetical protein